MFVSIANQSPINPDAGFYNRGCWNTYALSWFFDLHFTFSAPIRDGVLPSMNRGSYRGSVAWFNDPTSGDQIPSVSRLPIDEHIPIPSERPATNMVWGWWPQISPNCMFTGAMTYWWWTLNNIDIYIYIIYISLSLYLSIYLSIYLLDR